MGHGAVDAGTAALWIIAPFIAASLGLSPTQVGLIFTVMAISAGMTHIPASLVGETRYRGLFLLSTIWWVVGAYLAASIAPNFVFLLVFVALASAGAAAWHPVAMGTLAERMPGRRAMALAVHYVGGSFMEVLAPLIAGVLLVFMDWRSVIQITVVPALIMGVLFLRLHRWIRPPISGSMSPRDLRTQIKLVWSPSSLAGLGILGFHSMAMEGLWSMTPLYLVEERGFSSNLAGVLFSLMVLAGSLGAFVIGRLVDKDDRKATILIVLVTASVSPLLILWAPNTPLLIGALVLAGFVIMGLLPALIATVLGIVGGRQMVMIGLIMGTGDAVGGLGALLAGVAGETDLRLSLVAVSIMALGGVLLASMHSFAPASSQLMADESTKEAS